MAMGHVHCSWVRERLPLLVGDSDGLAGEGGDVPAEDRARVDRHLVRCAPCRNHRASLERALANLRSAATEPWNGREDPSIWPELEAQIQYHRNKPRPVWQRFAVVICPERLRLATISLGRGYERIRGEAPLQLAWLRDSVHEQLQLRPRFLLSRIASQIMISLRIKRRQVLVGFSLAATIVLLLALAVVHRQESQAEAQIAPGSAPTEILGGLSQRPSEQTMDVIIAAEPVTSSHASNSLVQADAAAPAEPFAPESNSHPAKAIATATSEATSALTSSPRYDFYLEQGTPMPPESRGSKPAY